MTSHLYCLKLYMINLIILILLCHGFLMCVTTLAGNCVCSQHPLYSAIYYYYYYYSSTVYSPAKPNNNNNNNKRPLTPKSMPPAAAAYYIYSAYINLDVSTVGG